MLTELFNRLFRPASKKIAFIDGDQNLLHLIKVYDKYVKNTGTETHFVRLKPPTGSNVPKALKQLDTAVNRVYVEGTAGKEVVDKFIAGYIQRAVAEGYTHITVISGDYDFIDIFKMAVVINEKAINVTFRMIIPHAKGRLVDLPSRVANIEVIKNS